MLRILTKYKLFDKFYVRQERLTTELTYIDTHLNIMTFLKFKIKEKKFKQIIILLLPHSCWYVLFRCFNLIRQICANNGFEHIYFETNTGKI